MLNLRKIALALTVFTLCLGLTAVVMPRDAWASANPCQVTCIDPPGWLTSCTWSYPGDPVFCCWTNAWIGCQSYRCSNGQLIITSYCP